MTLNCHNRCFADTAPQFLQRIKRACIGCCGAERLRRGEFMIAAKRSSGKFNAEMFGDVAILQRKWQAALRPGNTAAL
jgi:hypothetical protein